MIGVSFQPGQGGYDAQQNGNQPAPSNGVQEAIKVLSLRLPKVVGAQAAAPQALLGGTGGSMGSGRVDSVVNAVLAKMFPTAGMPQMGATSFGMAPGAPMNAPSFGGDSANPLMQMRREQPTVDRNFLQPRVTVGLPPVAPPEAPMVGGPPRYPNAPTPDGEYNPPAAVAPLPSFPQFPDFPKYRDDERI